MTETTTTRALRRDAFIGGRHVSAAETFPVYDPSTGELLAEVARSTTAEVDLAVDAARKAFDGGWKRTTAAQRAKILRSVADAIAAHEEELALLESRDTGKPLRQARVDVGFAVRFFEYYASMVEAVFGHVLPASTDRITLAMREPYGVTGHIIPWNYPIGIGTRTIAPSLAAGNCVVLKPAEEAPLSCLRLAEIIHEAGVPAGVLNVVPGLGFEAGAALSGHPGIDRISFTGSVPVGIAVAQAAALNLVPADLELGGKSPNLVFADANLDLAADVVAQSILQNAGQTCSAGARLLVERKIHEEFVDKVATRFRRTTLGPGPQDPGMGPVISRKQQGRVLDYISLGREEGDLIVGGGVPDDERLAAGNFVEPTLFDGVPADARIAQEEIFGPVLTVTSFDDTDEAIRLANGTEYGLVAGVWTSHVGRAHRLIRDLRCGQVMVNTFSNGVELPFSGRKRSGYGVEKGWESLIAFTQVKGAVVMMTDD
ncbi:aldehyde dehydrogenase family protein [Microbacterium capsulatum]|uniref:Aldehyde dehydrogenase family protein n=1 Tax=Microbacterium capsulatum TaxID=3041921 RepID=A0ABU0XD97_9MICO|nr:aldehyde dehydrogenase family protein [Microbacterium sp. ASV81]MDQ4213089.1 aldehyde dehydrogenase family protein [Microbacterium sp. ASV81]